VHDLRSGPDYFPRDRYQYAQDRIGSYDQQIGSRRSDGCERPGGKHPNRIEHSTQWPGLPEARPLDAIYSYAPRFIEARILTVRIATTPVRWLRNNFPAAFRQSCCQIREVPRAHDIVGIKELVENERPRHGFTRVTRRAQP
jgi:hypothetical protein